MTNDLTPSKGLPDGLPPQRASRALVEAISATRNPHPDVGLPACFTAAVQAEARSMLAEIMPLAVPVTENVVAMWLAPVLAGAVNASQPDDMPAWMGAVMLAVGHLERGAFTRATQARAAQRFTFFPSAAHIYDIVAGPAVEIRTRRAILERIVNGTTEEADR